MKSSPSSSPATRGMRGISSGFTIVETLIVLAVSGVLFLSAILLIAGQQRKVEFTQAVQEIRSSIEQTITEISTGYYPNAGNIKCTVSGNALNITTNPVGTPQGSNTGCIFLGKAIEFGVQGTDPQQYIVHTIAGLQTNDGTIESVNPKAVDIAGTRTTGTLHSGLQVVNMRYVSGGTTRDIGAVAFLNGLGSYSSSQLLSGTQQMTLVPIDNSGTVPNTDPTTVVNAINTKLKTSPQNPNGGVLICFRGGSNLSGLVTIGGNGRNLSVKLDMKSTVDCS